MTYFHWRLRNAVDVVGDPDFSASVAGGRPMLGYSPLSTGRPAPAPVESRASLNAVWLVEGAGVRSSWWLTTADGAIEFNDEPTLATESLRELRALLEGGEAESTQEGFIPLPETTEQILRDSPGFAGESRTGGSWGVDLVPVARFPALPHARGNFHRPLMAAAAGADMICVYRGPQSVVLVRSLASGQVIGESVALPDAQDTSD